MLAMIIQATQLAKQVSPNVYVTVQPAPGGMPEWVKILITAAVGAVVGILGNIAMEYVRPHISSSMARENVRKQLIAELLGNLGNIENAAYLMEKVENLGTLEREVASDVCYNATKMISSDRFDFYYQNQKNLIYEISSIAALKDFYNFVKGIRQHRPDEFSQLGSLLGAATFSGRQFLQGNDISFDRKEGFLEGNFSAMLNARKKEQPSQ